MTHRTVLSLLALAALARARPAPAQRALAFTHVAVIDGADSTPRPDQTVVVRGNRIVTVAPNIETDAQVSWRIPRKGRSGATDVRRPAGHGERPSTVRVNSICSMRAISVV